MNVYAKQLSAKIMLIQRYKMSLPHLAKHNAGSFKAFESTKIVVVCAQALPRKSCAFATRGSIENAEGDLFEIGPKERLFSAPLWGSAIIAGLPG